ncbi:MAG: peptidoglycan editing factor PgeF [Paracoccaceae bacterium]
MTLEIITHPDLAPFKHGFFTRRGGASSGVFSGLNCGPGSSDQTEIVAINRARAAEALHVAPGALLTVHQIHSPDVLTITDPKARTDIRADAMVTALSDVALGVLTADCQPVLFADKNAGVIGAAHAGWKGAMAGVLEATVDAMSALGATRANITAIIGPAISQAAYEVGPEFLESFLADDSENVRFFINGQSDRYHFDLPGYGLYRLRKSGIGRVDWTHHCTYADPQRFYSYRRSVHAKEADYGRLISAICI